MKLQEFQLIHGVQVASTKLSVKLFADDTIITIGAREAEVQVTWDAIMDFCDKSRRKPKLYGWGREPHQRGCQGEDGSGYLRRLSFFTWAALWGDKFLKQ